RVPHAGARRTLWLEQDLRTRLGFSIHRTPDSVRCMIQRLLMSVAVVSMVSSALLGCGGSEPEPQTPPAQATYPYPQATYGQQYPQQQYPQQQYPQQQYPQQQYPQQQYPQAGSPTAPAPAGTMSEPAPYSFPCQSDAQCLAHRCNVSAGKCAWPCQSNADCQAGFQCMAPACIPGGPMTAPTQ